MPHHVIRLLPFVFAGILCSILFPMDTTLPGGWPRPPPLYAGGSQQFHPPPDAFNAAVDFQGLLTQFITALWNALHSVYDFPTTSSREGPHGARELTNSVSDSRAMLWAGARALGWGGLERVVQQTLSNIGSMTTVHGGTIIRQEEVAYVRRLITRIMLELFSSFNPHAIFGPALYDDISNTFASGNAPFSPALDDRVSSFVAITISRSASLAAAVIRRIDEDAMVADAFRIFSVNPSSWTAYIQPAPNHFSIQEIVRDVHRSQGQSPSTLPIIPNSSTSVSPRALHNNIDLEAATGPFALCDGDIEYIAALLVAAILRFHRQGPIVTAA